MTMFDESVTHLSAADRVMRRLIREIGPCTLTPAARRAPFESLVQAVAHQQLHGKAAQTILRRFVALFPRRRFPRPEDVLQARDEQLRGVGFSGAKVAAIRDIAAKTLDGIVPTARQMTRLPDDEIIRRLTQVRGVGQWTVEMLLIFQLGRRDVLPVDDYGVRNGFRIAYRRAELPTKKELFAHGERWRPHRTVAAWYLWRAVDQAKQNE